MRRKALLVAGRTPEKIAQVVQTIRKTGGSAEPMAVDTTREDDVVRLFDRAISPGDGHDPSDLVVFNAGNNQRIDFRQLTAAQFEDFWRVGCFGGFGGFLVGREAARRLAPLGRGTVIFTGASASLRGRRVEMEPSNYRERSPPAGALTWPNCRLIADLDDASALAQAIVDTIRDPLLVLDQDLCVVTANRDILVREMFSLQSSNQMVEGSVCIGLWASCRVCARPAKWRA